MGYNLYKGLINKKLFDDLYKYRIKIYESRKKGLILNYRKKLDKCMDRYVLKNSLDIELHQQPKRKLKRQMMNYMNYSWVYLLEKKSKLISVDDIIHTNYIINMKMYERSFRHVNVRISGSSHPTVSVQRVPLDVMNLVNVLNGNISAVEKALAYHFHIARIHPFKDGNGRTARMIQDFKLFKNDFPPAEVTKRNRLQYYDLLDAACVAYINLKDEVENKLYKKYRQKVQTPPEYLILGCKPEIRNFMDFMGEKISKNLKKIIKQYKIK